MSNPIICNRAPDASSISKVDAPVRFSLRDSQWPIQRDTFTLYLGYGAAFYEASVIPEDIEEPKFAFNVHYGVPNGSASRTIAGDYLQISKTSALNQKSMYFFGGLYAPMEPDGRLMMEVSLKISEGDISPAPTPGSPDSGVAFGFFINDTGLMVKFFSDGVSRWIEIFDADQNSTQRPLFPATTYLANFDWDAVEYTYKLLWDPRVNRVLLVVSSGDPLTPDQVLIDGLVSDFPSVPYDQVRSNQPRIYFGHVFGSPIAISNWRSVYFYNETTLGVMNGIFQGEHNGFIRADNIVHYDTSRLPRDNDSPWVVLPDTYDDIDGSESIMNEVLLLRRTDIDRSFGFYRVEPNVANSITVLDFRTYGEAANQGFGVQVSGFEMFIDDSTKAVRIGFTDNLVKRTVGVLGTSPQSLQDSYLGAEFDWSSPFRGRVIYDPTIGARLLSVELGSGELVFTELSNVLLADLPTSSLPSPAVGFLHNGLIGDVTSSFYVEMLRYMTAARIYEASTGLPAGSWVKEGAGDTLVSDDILSITDDSDSAYTRYKQEETTLTNGDGVTVEFRAKVESYEVGVLEEPIRNNTGVGVMIDDGTTRLALMFAEAGPPYGKIAYFSTEDDPDDALFNIRSGVVTDNFCSVDWNIYHVYRVEKTIGGYLRLYVDDGRLPLIDIEVGSFPYPPTEGGNPKIAFGSLQNAPTNVSLWDWVLYSISTGYDVQSAQVMDEEDVFGRFAHASNILVEAENEGP